MLLGASVVTKFRFRHLSGILILTFDGLTFAKSHFFALPFVVNLNILYEQFQYCKVNKPGLDYLYFQENFSTYLLRKALLEKKMSAVHIWQSISAYYKEKSFIFSVPET